MIVCSCNALSDRAIKGVLGTGACGGMPEIFGCLGCRPQCGRCAPTVKQIIRESGASACGDCGPDTVELAAIPPAAAAWVGVAAE